MLCLGDIIGQKVVSLEKDNEGTKDEAVRIIFEDGIILRIPVTIPGIELLRISLPNVKEKM